METQQTIHEWCKETFPRHVGKKGRAIALLEESAELALAAGVSFEAIRQAVEVPMKKHIIREMRNEPLESDAGEVADVLLCLYAYAQEAGYDAHKELDSKMATNRTRTIEYYANKTAQKEDLGFILEDAPVKEG